MRCYLSGMPELRLGLNDKILFESTGRKCSLVERLLKTTVAGVQGWRSGESTRLPPMWPGFDSQIRRHMWVEFVGFLRVLRFPLSSK